MPPRRPHRAGFTLIELLIVLTVMGVLAGLVLPDSTPALDEQLRMAADVLKTDLGYARSLAIGCDSTYQIAFDKDENRYTLTHTGSNTALDELPSSPYRALEESTKELVVDFDELPQMAAGVRYEVAACFDSTLSRVDDVEFDSLGAPSRGGYTVIWLSAGEGDNAKYIYLIVYPVTGLVKVGTVTTIAPPATLFTADEIPEPITGLASETATW